MAAAPAREGTEAGLQAGSFCATPPGWRDGRSAPVARPGARRLGLGVAACEAGRRVRYATTAALVNELVEAAGERILSRAVARYGRYDLLCLDELGCAPRGADEPCGVRGPPPVVAATGRS